MLKSIKLAQDLKAAKPALTVEQFEALCAEHNRCPEHVAFEADNCRGCTEGW